MSAARTAAAEVRAVATVASARPPKPGRVIAGAFAAAIGVGTVLLSLPFATASGQRAALSDALFTATSAVCVTGLVTVDTGTYWSGFGQGAILALIQLGGLGIMTAASLVAIALSNRLSLRARMVAQAETRTIRAVDVRRVVRNVVLFSLAFELVVAVVLAVRFAVHYDQSLPDATYSGVFHSISAFNNAGFGLYSDSLTRYATDPWVCLTIAAAVVVGGLGFPVVFELARKWRRPSSWSIVTRVSVVVTGWLLAIGTVFLLAAEADNERTLGPLGGGSKLLAAFFAAVQPRTAGFNSIDVGGLRSESLVLTDALMFIGGGTAGTAGGIKITTFGLLAYVLWAEMRGDPDVEIGRRRVPEANQRQTLSVALLGIGLVFVATLAMLALTDLPVEPVVFETISAFGTVGLSTGITADLPVAAQSVLVALMFLGRIGPLTLACGLALRERSRRCRLPEERTNIG
ncbi:MAG: TrkH family potassium uptake protein [Sporichthyaceae bacterium]